MDYLCWVIVALTNCRGREVLICRDNIGNDMEGGRSSREVETWDCHQTLIVGMGTARVCSRSLASPSSLQLPICACAWTPTPNRRILSLAPMDPLVLVYCTTAVLALIPAVSSIYPLLKSTRTAVR